MNRIILCFDGACGNNSILKIMGIGIVAFRDHKKPENIISALDYYEMTGTNGTSNLAEYHACTSALMLAMHIKQGKIPEVPKDCIFHILGDSQVIIKQVNGRNECHKEHLQEYLKICNKLKRDLGDQLEYMGWIPREQNTDADKLSKQAITEFIEEIS